MVSATENALILWNWPLATARLAEVWMDTVTSAQQVVDARMPMIASAWALPLASDHQEIERMFAEKMATLARSQRSILAAQEKVSRSTVANMRALCRLAGAWWLGVGEWTKLFDRNMEIAATLSALPEAALAPVWATVKANQRRLGKR